MGKPPAAPWMRGRLARPAAGGDGRSASGYVPGAGAEGASAGGACLAGRRDTHAASLTVAQFIAGWCEVWRPERAIPGYRGVTGSGWEQGPRETTNMYNPGNYAGGMSVY